ncbi:C-5 cytosine methyltransferase DmtA [Cordyceps fumosorosea ARSEF 2679]|uniref:C-5 cytosine methyltransferase DmtA n=1 Tax=Cordyceps fumosorosea (strain ARSEF 2679) TaxID=1081104 RepID=A0A167NLC6_CORFA|nr:C-5 cytosine methyltransferase DmtA [Cordyceps fumosorosea ARSEF 2679]OAA55684.1 C-5 cytosine methyltransferase DmtA [Cordyceps fumosorosea ARSEF 2679]
MEEPPADIKEQDEETSRRTRMRLAQRRYRSKKHDALAAAEQKAAALETALRGTLSAFRGLQRSLLSNNVPPAVAVAVSRASLDISSLLHSSGVQVQDTLGCNLLDCSKTTCARKVLAEQLTRSAVPAPGMGGSFIEQGQPADALLLGADDVDLGRFFPQLHRKVEGAAETVLRLAPPHLQRLKYGLTRTWLDAADVPELAGEWLEAADVEEYLVQRGIHVRDVGAPQGLATLHLGSDDAEDTSEGPLTPEWEPELPDWTIFGKKLDDRQDIPGGVRVVSTASPPAGSWDAMGQQQQQQSPTPPTQGKITIDVDRLVAGLSSRGICLGPAPGIRRHHVDEAIQEAVQIC